MYLRFTSTRRAESREKQNLGNRWSRNREFKMHRNQPQSKSNRQATFWLEKMLVLFPDLSSKSTF